MRIILTNDDGIDAAGLLAARRALEKVGEVLTVAPDRNRSGVGRSITFGTPLHVEEKKMADGGIGYACTGTPVDCVRLVSLGLMDFEPDIGVSGLAVSLAVERPWHDHHEAELHFEPVASFAARLAKVSVGRLPAGRILTVNAPNLPHDELKGARITKLGRRFYTDELIEVRDAEGRVGYDI